MNDTTDDDFAFMSLPDFASLRAFNPFFIINHYIKMHFVRLQ